MYVRVEETEADADDDGKEEEWQGVDPEYLNLQDHDDDGKAMKLKMLKIRRHDGESVDWSQVP